MKAFLIDVNKCNGCYNCQIACKDEHCGNDWMPYAKPQPETGQFWCKLEEKVRGTVPLTRISYIPHIGGQSELLLAEGGDAVYQRDDGLIVIDPEKAKGRHDLCNVCEGVYWNDEFAIPQTCTGCAHLLDNGWTVPRCVDSCATEALRFGDIEDFEEELKNAEQLDEKTNVYYLNLPKRFVGGTVVDYAADEVVIGATVELASPNGDVIATCETNEFGDFMFNQIEPSDYSVTVKMDGYADTKFNADATKLDVNAGYVSMEK